jgi:dephospho-CoA kinase
MAHDNTHPFVIGVTGDIACGKSAVLGILGELGAETIDADRLYHQLIEPGKPLHAALDNHFGRSIIASDGSIDRKALAAIVFSDPSALSALDRITHPAVVTAVDAAIRESSAAVIAVDAVKLVESGMAGHCDQVWVVVCTPDNQLERLIARNGLEREIAQQRIAAQGQRAFLRDRADVVIDNSGTPAQTRDQVEAAMARIPILPS